MTSLTETYKLRFQNKTLLCSKAKQKNCAICFFYGNDEIFCDFWNCFRKDVKKQNCLAVIFIWSRHATIRVSIAAVEKKCSKLLCCRKIHSFEKQTKFDILKTLSRLCGLAHEWHNT